MVEGDRGLRGAHRRMEVGLRADRRLDALEPVGAGRERSTPAGGHQPRAAAFERRTVQRSRARVDEQERVVERVVDAQRRARFEPSAVESQLRAALRRHERPELDPVAPCRLTRCCDASHAPEHRPSAARRGQAGR